MTECDISTCEIGSDCSAEEIGFEYADEAIEAAAGLGQYRAAALTLSFCSGLDTCPA